MSTEPDSPGTDGPTQPTTGSESEGPDPDAIADLLDQAKYAALQEDWPETRDRIESALESLDTADEEENSESSIARNLASINFLIVAGIAIMLIGGILWFRAGIGLENISDDLRVIETFTNDVNRMKTILSLEDDRQSRQISQAVGIAAVVAGALVTVYAFTRPRR